MKTKENKTDDKKKTPEMVKMHNCIIVRYSEIALKGGNRFMFEDKLINNIKDCLKRNSINATVKKIRGRVIIYTSADADCLARVFGIASYSYALEIESELEMIKKVTVDYVRANAGRAKTFRMTANRPDKRFPVNSTDLNVMLGDMVNDIFGFSVDLKKPDLNVYVEVHNKTYIYHDKKNGPGGLPVGISGRIGCLIADERDAFAGWLMLKRGCAVVLVGKAREAEPALKTLQKYDYGNPTKYCPGDVNDIVDKERLKAVVVGATIEEFDQKMQKTIKVTVLTPLIGYDTEEIEKEYKKIKK